MKDFVTEPSEDKIRKAGHLMAQKLAGSLALVTCKEPLRSNLPAHIRHSLGEHGFSEVRLPCPTFDIMLTTPLATFHGADTPAANPG